MEMVLKLTILAVLVEGVVETFKLIYENGKLKIDSIMALVVGLFVSFSVGVDLFEVIGIESNIPFIGVVLTGILISRGGNFIHDFFKKVKGE